VVSPQRISAREASCSQFDAKLDSPGRNNVKVRRERRVQSLLPDIARRRKAELENPFATQGREGSIVPSQERSRQSSIVLSGRNREGSVIASQERSRRGSIVHSQERSRQESMVPSERSRQDTQEGSLIPPPSTTLEIQTKEVVKQTVIAALRLHSISPSDEDYKPLINQTVNSTMFALRGKFRVGKSVGMGEIGSIVEGLLEIFQPS
jgi:Sld7 C-terminal domain